MRIYVMNVPEKFRYDCEHIVKLFFETPEFRYLEGDAEPAADGGNPLFVRLHLREEENGVEADVRIGNGHGQASRGSAQRPPGEAKKAVNVALLRALAEFTGIEQPWGILTGVRPVKLYHNEFRKGKTHGEIARHLQEDYLIKPEKIRVMERIVQNQLRVVPDLYGLEKEVSIYIGIPFCPTKCAYCTFPAYSIQGRQGSVEAFLEGLRWEIEQVGAWLQEHGIGITTIYFGGGTPTSISAEEIDSLFAAIQRSFPNGGISRELTVEAGRPDTITPEKLEVLKKWKVDRISINPQSFIQETLKAIGRHHTVEETIEKFHLAREMGMNNINMDLIIGLPGEGMKEFEHSLSMVEKLRPESLTVHTLSFKSASEMTHNRERYPVAGREEVTAMVQRTERWTQEHGYVPYYLYRQKNILGNQENVGYAIPGKESIYNIMIMEERQTILGLGCGAVSKIVSPLTGRITRFANPKEPKVYNERHREYVEEKLRVLNGEYGFVMA